MQTKDEKLVWKHYFFTRKSSNKSPGKKHVTSRWYLIMSQKRTHKKHTNLILYSERKNAVFTNQHELRKNPTHGVTNRIHNTQ